MAYVVNGLCQNCKDTSCVAACPVDCFYEPINPDPANDLPNQLYISDDCVDCNACVSECPWEAITSGDDVPKIFKSFIALNMRSTNEPELFKPAEHVAKDRGPTTEEVQANKDKWGFKG